MTGICKWVGIFLAALLLVGCRPIQGVRHPGGPRDHSGIYCLNIQNLEMTIVQDGDSVAFTLESGLLTDGTGTVSGDTLQLTASTTDSAHFTALLTFFEDGQGFSGPYELTDASGKALSGGMLLGNQGECPEYDLDANGIPRFVGTDFTELGKIERISRFRSGFGHSFTDGFETCRSMKHYFNPYETYRQNQVVGIYSPVTGFVVSVTDDGHGASLGSNNKQIQIRPGDQPAFTFVLFHVDLVSPDLAAGMHVEAGDLLGYARLYYEDLDEHATSFDIAVWVNTPGGPRLVSYFDTLEEAVFADYLSRGAQSRQDFIIPRQARDADPLQCNGEVFATGSHLEDWVIFP